MGINYAKESVPFCQEIWEVSLVVPISIHPEFFAWFDQSSALQDEPLNHVTGRTTHRVSRAVRGHIDHNHIVCNGKRTDFDAITQKGGVLLIHPCDPFTRRARS